MAEMWKPHQISDYQNWVDAISDVESSLNSWELSFVESMHGRLANGWNLTQNQAEKLEQIYVRHTK